LPLADAAFLAALVALLPMLAVAQLSLVPDEAVERIPAYRASATAILVLGAISAVLGVRRAGWEGLGLGPMPLGAWATWTVGTLLAAVTLILALHAVRILTAIEESPLLVEMLPRTLPEKRLFAVLSFAAGFGEEIAFRGYALPVLAPHLGGPWGSAVFTSVVFGLFHAYQGPLGMARTMLLGLLLCVSFLLSGSLWPAIAAHVILDLLGGLVWGDRLTR